MERSTASRSLTALILETFRLHGRLLSVGDALARPAGQTSARWQVLGALDQDARTVAEIGRRMGRTRQSVQRTADLLEGEGLLAFADNPAHQRARLAMLTSRGQAALQAITTREIRWANGVASHLADDDLQRATRALRQVRAALDAVAVTAAPKPARHADRSHRPPRATTRRRS